MSVGCQSRGRRRRGLTHTRRRNLDPFLAKPQGCWNFRDLIKSSLPWCRFAGAILQLPAPEGTLAIHDPRRLRTSQLDQSYEHSRLTIMLELTLADVARVGLSNEIGTLYLDGGYDYPRPEPSSSPSESTPSTSSDVNPGAP